MFAFGALASAGKSTATDPTPVPAASFDTTDLLKNVAGSFTMLAIVLGFLLVRRISPAQLLGFRKISIFKASVVGALLVAAILPLLMVATMFMAVLLREKAREQEVVQVFREAAGTNQTWSVVALFFMAVVVAPLFEEIVFRGYLYGVFKRWAGSIASLIFTAALFAALHQSVTVLPSLVVLAIALTIAYEWSGSLLVPIAMHATFNCINLVMMLALPNLRPPS
jgi:membrane protease YdiL (CAAX protease family)